MDLDALILAAAGGLGLSAGGVVLLKLVLPGVRRIIPAAMSVSHLVEGSQARLITAVTAEREEMSGQLVRCRAELAECRGSD